MTGLPSVTMVGTLTSDPELRFTPSGDAVANFTVASNERRYNKATNSYEDGDATFLRGTVWRKYAENVAESLHKGDKVFVTGQLRQKSWEKDNQKRTTFEVDVEEVGPTLRFVTAQTSRSRDLAGAGAGSSSQGW